MPASWFRPLAVLFRVAAVEVDQSNAGFEPTTPVSWLAGL